MSWSARIPDAFSGRTFEFQAVARTTAGKTLPSTRLVIHFRGRRGQDPNNGDQGSGSTIRPQPDLGGNAR